MKRHNLQPALRESSDSLRQQAASTNLPMPSATASGNGVYALALAAISLHSCLAVPIPSSEFESVDECRPPICSGTVYRVVWASCLSQARIPQGGAQWWGRSHHKRFDFGLPPCHPATLPPCHIGPCRDGVATGAEPVGPPFDPVVVSNHVTMSVLNETKPARASRR